MTEPTHTPSTATCGCCSGVSARTPGVVGSRPGLPEIAYRSGTHGDFRASMLAALSRAGRPRTARLLTREDDDPTIALIDAFAVACDVLTFYTERLANESYLRTAGERASLRELGGLIAYRLGPGAAASTHLAFTLERPPDEPPGPAPDPGLLPPPPPPSLVLPAGLRVQSVPGPGDRPQTFETSRAIAARPGWNALPVTATRPYPPVRGRLDAWFAGAALNLRRGDAILFASEDLAGDRWDLRLVTETEEQPAAGRTRVRWDRPLGSEYPPNDPAASPEPFVLRRRLPVFGHNAPTWSAMNLQFREGYVATHSGSAGDPDWPGFDGVVPGGGDPHSTDLQVDLDGSHPAVVLGSWVVVSQEGAAFYRELYRVVGRSELSRSEFGVSGPVTRLVLRGERYDFGSPRDVTVFAVADPLALVEAPDPAPLAGAAFRVDGDASAMEPGRELVLSGRLADGTPRADVVVLASARALDGGKTMITLAARPPAPLRRDSAVLFGNVVPADHGETVRQVLGDGDARRSFQTMPLLHGPLTHVRDDSPRGASTLTVRVDDVAWRERPSLYGTGPQDRVFTTGTRPDGQVVVAFGDGVRGARLPSGSHNVRAVYRKGLGEEGNMGPGKLSQPMDRPLGLKAVTNPVPSTGGADPEDEAHARTSMPLPARTLGRAVSLQDYADFALAYPGVSRADASVLTLRAGRTIVVSVCGPGGGEAPLPTVRSLVAALRSHGDPRVRVLVLAARQPRFRLALKVRPSPDREPAAVLAAVGAALRGAWAPGARQLCEPVHRSQVVAVAAGVPGVVAVDLDLLYRGAVPSLQRRLLAAPAAPDPAGNPLAAELLALAEGPFDWLKEMP